jgi:hypothetical protein
MLDYSASLKSKPIIVTKCRDIIADGVSRDFFTLNISRKGRYRSARHFSKLTWVGARAA